MENKNIKIWYDDDAFAIIYEVNKLLEQYGLRFEAGEGGDSFQDFDLIEIPKE